MFVLIINLYKINPDNSYGGMEESYSEADIGIANYTPPVGFTFKAPNNETDIWDGNDWGAPYVPTLKETKETRIAEINEAFEAHISGRTTISLGWDMQFNLKDILMVDGAFRSLEMTGGTEGYLTDADNINHYGLSVQQIKQALLEMTVAHMQAHAKKQELRTQVEVATDKTALSALIINF